MDNTILKVNHLTKTYGTKTALKDVSFTVEKGKIYGFIGEMVWILWAWLYP